MGAKNKVLAGDYIGKQVVSRFGWAYISVSLNQEIILGKETIDSYEVITDEQRKSAASGIARGLVGGALLGPVGMLAGLSAKSKGIYQIAIQFSDGKKSLIEVDDKIYKQIIKANF